MEELKCREGLALLPVSESRLEELHDLVVTNFDHLRQWMPWAVDGYSINHTRSFVAKSKRDFGTRTTMNYHVVEDGVLAGGIGLNFIDRVNRGTEIGYWLGEDFTGRALMTLSVRRLTEFAFEELGMHRMNIRCAAGNTRSRSIPERLGFKEEGTLRDAEWLHDRFIDLVVYGMLRPEWGDQQTGSIE